MGVNKTVFETEMQVRPDDIDMFQHVHSSKYIDYVLAARYDQMKRCYNMPMEEFMENGWGWVIRETTIRFKRALKMGETMIVQTNIETIEKTDVAVSFAILNKATSKVCCDGIFHYTLIDMKNGRAQMIPDWVIERYSI